MLEKCLIIHQRFEYVSDDLTCPRLVYKLVNIILLFPEVLLLVIFRFLNLFLCFFLIKFLGTGVWWLRRTFLQRWCLYRDLPRYLTCSSIVRKLTFSLFASWRWGRSLLFLWRCLRCRRRLRRRLRRCFIWCGWIICWLQLFLSVLVFRRRLFFCLGVFFIFFFDGLLF